MEGDNIIMNMYKVIWMEIEQGANKSMITTRCRWVKLLMEMVMVMKMM